MFLREMFESPESVGIIFGRFNPPHKGHRAAWELASKNTHWFVGTNKGTIGPKDPLPFEVKVEAMKTIWPEIEGHIVAETSWLTLASKVFKEYGDVQLNIYTDEDWVTKTIQQYNGKESQHGFYNFSSIQQKPTPRLSSATALRAAVQAGDRDGFSDAAGVSADTPVAGEKFFDLVARYLLSYETAPKKAPARKKKEVAASLESLSEDALNEMAYDSMVIPVHGKIMWLNEGGAHMIAKRDPNGSLNILMLGSHEKIAKKWAELKAKYGKKVECAGVGIVNKQNSTADVGPGTIRKNLKAFHLTDDIIEAAYHGNIGMMELFQFFSKADPELVAKVKGLIAQHKDKEVWNIIQNFTGTKLVGKEFNETASAGATSAGNIATVASPHLAIGNAKIRKQYGKGGSPKPPTVNQAKNPNGTAKNALDLKGTSLFGGSNTVKR